MQIPPQIIALICDFFPMVRVIIKNGSGLMKTGFAKINKQEPDFVFPTITGIPRQQDLAWIGGNIFVGNEATSKRGILALRYPIEHGIVTNWDDITEIWRNIFDKKLTIPSKESEILLTEKPLNPKTNREKMVQIMFELFNVNGLCIAIDSVLSLYATDRLTGCVLNIGESATHTVPIYQGHCIKNAVQTLDIGGRDITDFMMRILTERGYYFTTNTDRQTVKDIKEKLCYVAEDFDQEMYGVSELMNHLDTNYELPDGQVITVGTERIRGVEPLFKPQFIGLNAVGIDTMLNDSIMACSKELRKEMYGNIILSGGSAMFPKMKWRITREIVVHTDEKIKVISPPNMKNLAWIGGNIFVSTSRFGDSMITRKQYDEYGPSIVRFQF